MTPEERAWNVVNEVCPQWWDVSPSMVKKFLEAMAVALREAVAEEREACARVVEGYEPDYGSDLCGRIAAAIRARKGGLK